MQSELIFFIVPVGAGASHIHFCVTKVRLFPEICNKKHTFLWFGRQKPWKLRLFPN